MTRLPLRPVLLLDGWGMLPIGLALLAGAGPLTAAAGLDASWPMWALGAVFVLYGVENLAVARRPGHRAVGILAGVDVGFAAVAAAVAAVGLPGAEPWIRIGLLVLAAASLGMGAAKLVARRALVGERERPRVRAPR